MKEKTIQELTKLLNLAGQGNLIPERLVSATIKKLEQLQTEIDKHRWIPVSEGPPKLDGMSQSLWVHITDGQSVIMAYYYDYTKRKAKPNMATGKGWYKHGMPTDSITHWKPIILPEK